MDSNSCKRSRKTKMIEILIVYRETLKKTIVKVNILISIPNNVNVYYNNYISQNYYTYIRTLIFYFISKENTE